MQKCSEALRVAFEGFDRLGIQVSPGEKMLSEHMDEAVHAGLMKKAKDALRSVLKGEIESALQDIDKYLEDKA